MPRGDGTGPQGQGRGKGVGRSKGGRFGCLVVCICPNCGKELPHTLGVPCNSIKCPQCGTVMTRKN